MWIFKNSILLGVLSISWIWHWCGRKSCSLLFPTLHLCCSPFLLWHCHYMYVTAFVVAPQLLNIMYCFSSSLFSFFFSFGDFCWDTLRLRDCFLDHVSFIMRQLKVFFISVIVLSLSFLFGPFFEFPSFCLHCLFFHAICFVH